MGAATRRSSWSYSIQEELDVGQNDLHWIIIGYGLMLGGVRVAVERGIARVGEHVLERTADQGRHVHGCRRGRRRPR